MAGVKDFQVEAGYLVVTYNSGPPRRIPISKILRAADIPTGLTYTQVTAITALANMTGILIRTLIARDILDESFLEDGEYTLESITEAIEQMGGDYGDPDISTS